MSRRITFFVLATSATLIATQASADRECFEDSCRLTDAPEAAQLLPSAQMDESAAPEASAAVQAAATVSAPSQAGLAPNALAPKGLPPKALPEVVEAPVVVALPQVAASAPASTRATPLDVTPYPQVASPRIRPLRVAEPVVRQPPPVQTFTDEAPLPREKAKPAQRYAKSMQPAPVRVAHKLAPVSAQEAEEAPETVAVAAPVSRPRQVRVSSTEPGYVQGYNQIAAPGIVVVVPPVTHLAGRYLVAPNAKIISIDSDD